MAEDEAELERLLELVRGVEPSPSEVARAVERLERPTRRRPRAALLAVTVMVGVLVITLTRIGPSDSEQLGSRPAPAPESPAEPIRLHQGAPITVRTEHGPTEVSGVGSIVVKSSGVQLQVGRATFSGRVDVSISACEVAIDGTSEVARVATRQVQVVVIAGTAESRAPDDFVCTVEDLPPPPRAGPTPRRPDAELALPPPRVAERPEGGLRVQLRAYRRARAHATQGRTEDALRAFTDFRRRWPRSSLRPEVDLQIIDLLERAGRRERARAEARRFLARHPESPRADELRRIVSGH